MKTMTPSAFRRSQPFCGPSSHAGKRGDLREGDINYSTAAANNILKVNTGASECALHRFLPLHALRKVLWTSETIYIKMRTPSPEFLRVTQQGPQP